MKMLTIGLLLTTSVLANNDLSHRPRSFTALQGKAVFVDFTEATYDITYDITKKEAQVTALMKFEAPEAGHVVFDSVTAPTSIELNGMATTALETETPSQETTVRVLNTPVEVGSHILKVSVPLNTLVEFDAQSVKSAFWTSDLSSRQFLERYVPASFEYDRVKMVFNINFVGGAAKQAIYTNGNVESTGDNSYRVTYPDYFNASSLYFHTAPESSFEEIRYTLKSIDGREIPVVIYVSKNSINGALTSLEKFRNETNSVFHELESDYGAWPHPMLIIYNAGRGGMEYCGATITEFRALGHELFHSYFARGMQPANGNSGWLDEALASWRDNGYKSLNYLSGTSMMSSHPYYTRTTDRDAYSFGERFMRLMNGKLRDKGGLKPFMRHIIETRIFAPMFVEEFIAEMEQFYGTKFEADFKRYTFGKVRDIQLDKSKHSHHHSMHPKMSVEELKNYL